MKKRIIEIIVNDEYVLGSGVVIGAAGSDNSVILRAKFNDKWLGLNVYATFRDSKGENPVAVLLCPTMVQDSDGKTVTYDIEVPSSSTAIDGKLCVVFSGFVVTGTMTYNAGENKYDQLVYRDAVINTTNAYFRVLPSDFSALDVEDKVEATLLDQLLGEINAFRDELDVQDDKISEVYKAFKNGDFKGDAYVITEADKKEIADISIEALRNEFDEALDAIIAIQKELMDEITFTIFHASTSVEETLTAREKMTWREWCDSEYNTIGAYALNDSNSAIIMHDVEGGEHYIHYKYNAPDYIEARADDIIEEGHKYYCPDWGA